jgi:hypothetical protein
VSSTDIARVDRRVDALAESVRAIGDRVLRRLPEPPR